MPPKSPAAHRFIRTRRDHATETAEDYTELIADLIAEKGEARVGDIAASLGVTHVAVSRMVGRLKRQGLAKADPYGPVSLSPKGKTMAQKAKKRHEIVVSFLRSLGVPADHAEADAEGIEHHCSPATVQAMAKFSKR
jgi:DtxR family manganese transport transcriptional regulator